ncbi:hypothetical protein Pcinc_008586 [Petrolisthes cinctipes]|uniref:Uncharacterized protein n=1 Tax=Petrolisthes cinctipes TaxID=88211 RepID=A0AAE1G6Y7_PETCI|nr:hypothetical protein Pcinc_008586 [Petrolisthes cinctipes]
MGARYMVAPGSTLNAKKEEMMRLSRISDVNNVKYCDLDVNVSCTNSAWRIGEIVKAACGGSNTLTEKAKKKFLLGSVTSLTQQKASTRINDPSTLLQTNSVVDEYITREVLSAEELIIRMSYQQRFFPEICNHSSRLFGSTARNDICPGDLLVDYKHFRKAMGMAQNNGCGVFLDGVSSVPTSSTQQGILDAVVQSQPLSYPPKENSLAIEAMTDSTVDMVSSVSYLRSSFSSAAGAVGSSESECLFNLILGGERIKNPSTLNTVVDVANNRSLLSSVLDVSERKMTDMVRRIEESIEKKRLEQAIGEIKKNVFVTASMSNKNNNSVLPSRSFARALVHPHRFGRSSGTPLGFHHGERRRSGARDRQLQDYASLGQTHRPLPSSHPSCSV